MSLSDLETYYTKRYSVAKIGLDRYVKHPDFRVTLVSIVTEDGFEWVGEPQNLPVERLNGHTLISHNAEFDSVCARAAIFKGQMPEFMPADWICTADMASYHQLPRSLPGQLRNCSMRNYPRMPVNRWQGYRWRRFRRIRHL